MFQQRNTPDLNSVLPLVQEIRGLGRRCADAGLLTQAEALLKQAWSIGQLAEPSLETSSRGRLRWSFLNGTSTRRRSNG